MFRMKELGKELSHAGLFWQNILIKCDCSKFLLFCVMLHTRGVKCLRWGVLPK